MACPLRCQQTDIVEWCLRHAFGPTIEVIYLQSSVVFPISSSSYFWQTAYLW